MSKKIYFCATDVIILRVEKEYHHKIFREKVNVYRSLLIKGIFYFIRRNALI